MTQQRKLRRRNSQRRRANQRRCRLELLETRRVLSVSGLQNPTLPEDVNADYLITSRDALIVISELMDGSGESEPGHVSAYVDVNGDDVVSSRDALHVIESLSAGTTLLAEVVNLEAHMSNAEGARGKIEYEVEPEHGGIGREFSVTLKGAPVGTYDVLIDGTLLGQITTNDLGYGRARWSTHPSRNELPLPPDFPLASEGTPVEVVGLFTGSMAADDSPSDPGDSSDASGTTDESSISDPSQHIGELEAHMRTDSGARGKAQLEIEPEHGGVKTEFKVRIRRAPAGTYDVLVDGFRVGTIEVNQIGNGEAEWSSHSDDEDKLPLPADFPGTTIGSTVEIAGLFTGTMKPDGAPHRDDSHSEDHRTDGDDDSSSLDSANDDSSLGQLSDDSSNHDRSSDDDSQSDDDSRSDDSHSDDDSSHEDHRSDGDDDSSSHDSSADRAEQLSPIELEARLRGQVKARGEVKYEVERENGGWKVEFKVKVKNAARGAHDVLVGGVKVGQIRIDSRGRGELEFSSHPDDDAAAFPGDFPEVGVGTVVEVVGLFSGKLELDD